MSCNRGVHLSDPAAVAEGVPALEANWSAGRGGPRQCGECGGWLRDDGGCTKCENGAGSTPGATLAAAVKTARAAGETVTFTNHWRREFARSGTPGHQVIALRNGESLASGQRFDGEDYSVPLGKEKRFATVGTTITPAIDGMVDWERTDKDVIIVKTADGGIGYYDPARRASYCDGNCAASKEGMCPHQMAAIIVGEREREPGSVTDADLLQQLKDELSPAIERGRTLRTTEVLRRGDAVYAYLKTNLPEVQANAAGIKPVPQPAPKPAAPIAANDAATAGKKKAAEPSTLPASRGNPAVSAIMMDMKVRPPLPVTADQLSKDPTGYTGFPVPKPNPRYEVGKQEKETMEFIMKRTAMSWAAARRRVEAEGGDVNNLDDYPAEMEDRCWGLYGPPGTGKNSMAKEIAASLGLGYMEVDVRDRSDFQALLCDVVFPKEGDKTYSEVRLGPIGQALASGNVVAINEIVAADPDAQTALHQVLQDGIIRAPGPEGATKYWRVHPNSLVFLTWNPNTTRQDKPGAALLSRTPSLEMGFPEPEDEARRLSKAMEEYLGEPPDDKIKNCVNLINGLRQLHLRGELETCPTFREMVSFAKSYYLNNKDRHKAAAVLKVLCSQAPGQKEEEWKNAYNLVDSFQTGNWKAKP